MIKAEVIGIVDVVRGGVLKKGEGKLNENHK